MYNTTVVQYMYKEDLTTVPLLCQKSFVVLPVLDETKKFLLKINLAAKGK
jgi:hypothetical protein